MPRPPKEHTVSEPFKPAKKREEAEEDWLVTFADMATLLLCFFIILFAVSQSDPEDAKRIREQLSNLGYESSASTSDDPYEQMVKETMELNEGKFEQILFVTQKKKKVNIELASSAFFASGTAQFKKSALEPLAAIAEKLMPFLQDDIRINIEGHTDDVPISTPQFPSNWELSTARASNVVRYLIAQGMPADRLSASGYADTQPKAENTDLTGAPIPENQELNRRVIITLERMGRKHR